MANEDPCFFLSLRFGKPLLMNATFETIRKELKPHNAEENEAPPKILVGGAGDFLNTGCETKKNSQFILSVIEFYENAQSGIITLLDELAKSTGNKPLAFFYDDELCVNTVIEDFKDYYNLPLNNNVFQRISASQGQGKTQFCLVIVILESSYYK